MTCISVHFHRKHRQDYEEVNILTQMNEVFVNREYLFFFHLKRICLTKNKTVNFFLLNIRHSKYKVWIWSAFIGHSRATWRSCSSYDVKLNSNSSNMSLLMLFFRINFNGIQIINNNIPSKILCSASICQYVIPEVDGDSERGLCWSITRIRKWTKKIIWK